MGRISVVGIATRYWLDGPGIESHCRRDFPHPVQTGPGAHPSSHTMGTGRPVFRYFTPLGPRNFCAPPHLIYSYSVMFS